jgi:hypothetical protein
MDEIPSIGSQSIIEMLKGVAGGAGVVGDSVYGGSVHEMVADVRGEGDGVRSSDEEDA